MGDPLEYYDKLDFNTRHQPLYSHVIEQFPKANQQEIKVRLCRCWQSHKFPYCDDTHKLLVENGDDVGPYVVRLRAERSGQRQPVKLRQPAHVPGTAPLPGAALYRLPAPRVAAIGWCCISG